MALTWKNQTVLITGASSGIGKSLALGLVSKHLKALHLVARRTTELESLKAQILAIAPQTKVTCHTADLRDAAVVHKLFSSLCAEQSTEGLDVIINNAGHGDYKLFETTAWEKTNSLLTLNINSLVQICQIALPHMVKRKRGGIINISSIVGLVATPGMATYVGSKHFVSGFTRALQSELKDTGVFVIEVCPGPVATEFEGIAIDGALAEQGKSLIEISADECAAQIIRAYENKRPFIVPGVIMNVVSLILRALPLTAQRFIWAIRGKGVRKELSR